MKNWKKKINLAHLDVGNRDFPCMIYGEMFYIGNEGSSHSTMVQEIVYGMNFTETYNELYFLSCEHDEAEYPEGIDFFRREVEEKSSYCFGHVLGKEIFWDVTEGKGVRENVALVKKVCSNKYYSHYMKSRGQVVKFY